MSVRVSSAVWDGSHAKGSNLIVLLALADVAKDNGIAWPGMAYLSKRARLSDDYARRCVRALCDSGELKIEREGGGRYPNMYRVNVAALESRRLTPPDDAETPPAEDHSPTGDTPPLEIGAAQTHSSGTPPLEIGAAPPGAQEEPLKNHQQQEPSKNQEEKFQEKDCSRNQVREVWDHYCETMQPRSRTLDDGARGIIRDALKVATVDELKRAISKCSNDDFYMGRADPSRYQGKPRKYNHLSHIIRGKRGVRSTREQIDLMLDLEGADGSLPQGARYPINLQGAPAVIAGTIRNHRQYVREMFEQPENDYAQALGRQSEEWLRDQIGHKPIVEDGRLKGWDYA